MASRCSPRKTARATPSSPLAGNDPFEFCSPSKSPPKPIGNRVGGSGDTSSTTRSSLRLAGSPPPSTNGCGKGVKLPPSIRVTRTAAEPPTAISCLDNLKLTIRKKSGEVKSVRAKFTASTSSSSQPPFTLTTQPHPQPLKRTVAITSSISEGPSRPKMAKSVSLPVVSSASTVASSSGSRLLTSGRKRAVYNHRLWQDDEDSPRKSSSSDATLTKSRDTSSVKSSDAFDFDSPPSVSMPAPSVAPSRLSGRPCEGLAAMRKQHQLRRVASASAACSNSVRVPRPSKGLYTVIRHVKDASECQERGETQEFLDEIEYLLEGLRAGQSEATRALSVLSLAEKCAVHNFRMHMKSHGLWARVFSKLSDCKVDLPQELSLCVAGLFYIMSRDRFTCELDRDTLRLMLRLLDAGHPGGESVDRARRKLADILEKCHTESRRKSVPRIHYKTMTPKDLAMEALLSLSVRKASDWFKDEVRLQRGLDHIIEAVSGAVEYFGDDLDAQDLNEFMLDRLNRIESFMRLLENMTYKNAGNQNYVVEVRQRQLLDQLRRCLALCHANMPFHVEESAEKRAVAGCLLAVLRVLLNCTHDNTDSCERLGANAHLLNHVLECVLQLPQYLPQSQRFDLLTLALGFLINLVEHCDENRRRLAYARVSPPYESTDSSEEKREALDALVQLFLLRDEKASALEQAAREEEEKELAERARKAAENGGKEVEEDEDEGKMQWRLIEDRRERRRPARHPRGVGEQDEEDDSEGGESDDGADIEFMPSSQEEDAKLQNALSKAGQHMEESLVAAYTALLLGCLVQENRRLADRLRMALPSGQLKPMVDCLAKFLSFMSLTSAVGNQGGQSILKILKLLDKLDQESA